MDKYAEVYLSSIASLNKEANFADIAKGVGGFAKSMVVDPFVDTVKDVGGTVSAIGRGDWADAGGKALSAGLNGVNAVATASMVIPGLGQVVGMPAKGLAMAAKGALTASKGLRAAKYIQAASKVKGISRGLTAAEKGLHGLTNASTAIKGFGQKVINAGNVIPGASWLGLNVAKSAPKGLSTMGRALFYAKNFAKPIATMAGLGIGSDALQGISYRGQFEDLATDPNFREWMGPDRQDALLEKARTDTDKVNAMKMLDRGGYLDVYRSHLKNTLKEQEQSAADKLRMSNYATARSQNLG